MGKIKIHVNNSESLEILLQKIYDECDMEMNQAQNSINTLRNSTTLIYEGMDAKAKYSKAINDMLSIKEKMLRLKIDISKVLSEVIKFNGDVNKAMNNIETEGTWDVEAIKKQIDEINEENDKEKQVYTLNK